MRTRRLLLSLFALALLLNGAAAELALPDGLKVIEAEAFLNDASVRGVVAIPEGVERIGENAFANTGMYAMDVPATVAVVGAQYGLDAAYVRFRGADTELLGISGVRCVIAPSPSVARQCAEDGGALFVSEDALVEADGFFYEKSMGALKLLCAADASATGSKVSIPPVIDGLPVNDLSDFAFKGCEGITDITLPGALAGNANLSAALADAMGAHTAFVDPGAGPDVVTVTTDAAGEVSGEITWRVEGFNRLDGDLFSYALTRDGEEYQLLPDSAEDAFSSLLTEPGAYQLSVEIWRAGEIVARGISPRLLIASEALALSAPEAIRNGANLSVEVTPLSGALSYYILLTREDTGASFGARTLPAAGGTATFAGYALEPGEYRVTGYVYGNDYAASVPTVRRVTVLGEPRPACPALQVPAELAAYRTATISLTGGAFEIMEPAISGGSSSAPQPPSPTPYTAPPVAVVRASMRYPEYAEGSGSSHPYPSGYAQTVQQELYGDSYALTQTSEGLHYELAFTVCVDGVWSEWSDNYTVDVVAPPPLPDPAVTFLDPDTGAELLPEEIVPGRAVDIRIDCSYANIGRPALYLLSEGAREEIESIVVVDSSSGNTRSVRLRVPVRELMPGEYRLEMYLRSQLPYYSSPEGDTFAFAFTVPGEAQGAPTVTADKADAFLTNDAVTLSIHAEGADSAYVEFRLGDERSGYSTRSWTRSLYEDGNATVRADMYYDDDRFDGIPALFQASVSRGGLWSAWTRVNVTMHLREQLGAPAVVPEAAALSAGQDLRFSFAPVAHASQYEAELYSENEGRTVYHWNVGEARPGTVLTLPGYASCLDRGSYTLRVIALADDYRPNTGTAALSVTGRKPDGPAVAADRDEIRIHDSVTFTVTDPDAEEIRVGRFERREGQEISYAEQNTSSLSVEGGAAAYTWRVYWEEGTDVLLGFAANRNGIWSGWTELCYTVQGLPQLDGVAVRCRNSYAGGEDVGIGFNAVPNATRYSYDLYNPSGKLIDSRSDETPFALAYAGYELEPGTYRAVVEAHADGYASGASERVFTVGAKAGAPAVAADKTILALHERATFTITAPGAEALVARTARDGSASWSYTRINAFEDETQWTRERNWSGSGSLVCAFAALVDGRWTEWSPAIGIASADAAPLPEPVIAAPASADAWRDFEVSVAAAAASRCDVELLDARDALLFSGGISLDEGGTLTIPGYLMAPGTATLRVTAYGDGGSASAEQAVTVATGGARPDAPVITPLSRTEIARQSFAFDIPTSGADRVAVRYYRSGYSNDVTYLDAAAEGDSTAWTDYRASAGETWKYAFAVRAGGVWSPWSGICTVQIAEP